MKKILKNKLLLLIVLGVSFFTTHTHGMAKLRALAQPLVRGFQALKQSTMQDSKQIFFKNQLSQQVLHDKNIKKLKNNNLNHYPFYSNGGGYKSSHSESAGFDSSQITPITKSFFGPLFVIVGLNQANNERLDNHFETIRQLLQNKQFQEASEYLRSLWFITETFAQKTLKEIMETKAFKTIYWGRHSTGTGYTLLHTLSQENKNRTSTFKHKYFQRSDLEMIYL